MDSSALLIGLAAYTRLDITDEDAAAVQAVNAAYSFAEEFCGRTFLSAEYDEWYRLVNDRRRSVAIPSVPEGWTALLLNQYPVTDVDAIAYAATKDGDETALTDYAIEDADAGLIRFEQSAVLVATLLPATAQVGGWLHVEYTAGWESLPSALELIIIEHAAAIYQSGTVDSTMESEKIGDYSYKRAAVASLAQPFEKRLLAWKKRRV